MLCTTTGINTLTYCTCVVNAADPADTSGANRVVFRSNLLQLGSAHHKEAKRRCVLTSVSRGSKVRCVRCTCALLGMQHPARNAHSNREMLKSTAQITRHPNSMGWRSSASQTNSVAKPPNCGPGCPHPTALSAAERHSAVTEGGTGCRSRTPASPGRGRPPP